MAMKDLDEGGMTTTPANFCRILEPDNPDYSERFQCRDCGENFITICSYARLKLQMDRLEGALREIAEKTTDGWAAPFARAALEKGAGQ